MGVNATKIWGGNFFPKTFPAEMEFCNIDPCPEEIEEEDSGRANSGKPEPEQGVPHEADPVVL
jgi:hypothetical protein